MSKLTVQKGFQEQVFNCQADIAVVGGAMGAGKSYALILEMMKHIKDPHFRCGVFRKNRGNLLCSGGLWEELGLVADAMRLKYSTNKHQLVYKFESGASIHMCHGNHPNFKQFLKGTQFTAVFIDEADEFDEEIFKFLIARMRSKSKTKPYMRLTTNPTEGWIKTLIKPFLQEDEYPISKLSGKLHYLYFMGNTPIIKPTKKAFLTECDLKKEDLEDVRTFTFIAGKVTDNKKLLENNPEYLSNLKILPTHERDKYLYGWWGEMPKDGLFKEQNFSSYSGFPESPDRCIITCDTGLAGGERSDFTVASCWALKGNKLYLVDMTRGRWKYQEIKQRIKTFLEENEFAEACYIEDYHSGSVLLSELKEEVFGMHFRPIRRDPRISKAKRAYQAVAFLNKAEVFIPIDHDKIRKPFLREVCAFSVDMTHANDDICDTFFDACIIFGRGIKSRKREQKELSHAVENVGSMSRVQA